MVCLQLSRSLGDFRHKTFKEEGNYIPSHQPISPDPDFSIQERDASKVMAAYTCIAGIKPQSM